MQHFDAIVIGFGKAGKTLAGKLASTGKQVAIIEQSDRMYGGTCINIGCIPSKSLVTSSQKFAYDDKNWLERSEYYRESVNKKIELVRMLRKKNFAKLNDLPNVTIFDGKASFVSLNRVAIAKTDGTKVEISADKILINTGATPVMPPIPGLVDNQYVYTSTQLMSLKDLPRHLVIIGGGYIGLEFASMYAGFGSEVSVIQDIDELIPREDRDVAKSVQESLEAKGVTFYLGTKINRIEDDIVYITTDGEEVPLNASAILVATGRKPNTAGLNLSVAGVDVNERGAIIVNDKLETTAPNIWAAGDVHGGLQFTYTSLDDFRIIWSQLNGGDYTLSKRKAVPYSVFIDPPLSRVGMSETEARERGYEVKVAKLPTPAIPKAQVLGHPQGFLKAVIDAKTDLILGVVLLCEESYEMINLVKLAMDNNLPYQVLRDQIYTHPTMTEAFNDLFAI